MSKTIISTKGLTKQFEGKKVVDNLAINLKQGEIYGFLGPNGAGKSTTMKMILNLITPSSGEIKFLGKTIKEQDTAFLTQIGALIEEPSYYGNLTAQENLEIVQRLMHLPPKNVEEVLKIVGLTAHRHKLAKNYSLGMKQRLGIALALVKYPKVLILDEPTNGLDPAGRQEIRQLIKELPAKFGMTIMISSHLLSEIEAVATTVGIIKQGKLLFQGQLQDLEEAEKIELEVNQPECAKEILLANNCHCELINGQLLISNCPKQAVAMIVALLVKQHIDIYQIKRNKRSLESIFLEMTKGSEGVI